MQLTSKKLSDQTKGLEAVQRSCTIGPVTQVDDQENERDHSWGVGYLLVSLHSLFINPAFHTA